MYTPFKFFETCRFLSTFSTLIYRSFAAVGVDPAVMGIGPAVAIPAAVKAAGLELDDIDLFEINEVTVDFYFYFIVFAYSVRGESLSLFFHCNEGQ